MKPKTRIIPAIIAIIKSQRVRVRIFPFLVPSLRAPQKWAGPRSRPASLASSITPCPAALHCSLPRFSDRQVRGRCAESARHRHTMRRLRHRRWCGGEDARLPQLGRGALPLLCFIWLLATAVSAQQDEVVSRCSYQIVLFFSISHSTTNHRNTVVSYVWLVVQSVNPQLQNFGSTKSDKEVEYGEPTAHTDR